MQIPFTRGDRLRVIAPIPMLCFDEDGAEYFVILERGEEGVVHGAHALPEGHPQGAWIADVEWDSGWYLLAPADATSVERSA